MSGRRIGWQSVVRLVTYYAVAALAVWTLGALGSRGDPGIVAAGIDSVAGRRRIEARLEEDTKRWESAAVEEVNGQTSIEYVVSLRKRVPLAELDRALREAGATSVELVGEQLASRPG